MSEVLIERPLKNPEWAIKHWLDVKNGKIRSMDTGKPATKVMSLEELVGLIDWSEK